MAAKIVAANLTPLSTIKIDRFVRPLASVMLLCMASTAFATVGATTPFTSFEAENATLAGGAQVQLLTSAPTNQYSSPLLEASGHAFAQLTATGQAVTWTNTTGQNFTAINVRYCIPDTPTGGGTNTTLDLYVDGVFRQALAVNSRQTWLYENSTNYNDNDQNPADGLPRVFFDDIHAFIAGAGFRQHSGVLLH